MKTVFGTTCIAILLLAAANPSIALSISFQQGVSPSSDYDMEVAFSVSSDDATQNRGTSNFIQIGPTTSPRNAYFGFDLSAIPYGSAIQSVTLTLTAQAASGETTDEVHSIDLHQMIGSFEETNVSYVNRDIANMTPWSTLGGDYNPTPVASTSGNPFTITGGQQFVLPNTAAFRSAISAAVNGSGSAYFVLDTDSNDDNDRGLFRFHSDDASTASFRPKLDIEFAPAVSATVNRTTGEFVLQSAAGANLQNIIGYSLISEDGSLDRDEWLTIKGRYDGTPPGNQSFDIAQWTVLTGDGGPFDLSEGVFSGNGGTIGSSQTYNFGSVWLKNPDESDLRFELLIDDGTPLGRIVDVPVTFVPGAGGFTEAFQPGDLNFDGSIDEDDFFDVFVPAFLSNTSALSEAQAYRLGDLNDDGLTDTLDFIMFNRLYKAAQPGAAALAFPSGAAVPEPSTIALLAIAAVGLVGLRRRAMVASLVVLVGAVATVPASAVTVRNLTTGQLLFFDDFESAPEVTPFAYGETGNDAIDADPVVPAGSPAGAQWQSFNSVNEPLPIEPQISDIQVVTGTSGNNPGAFFGANFLRAQRSSDGVSAFAIFTPQTTPGHKIRMQAMVYAQAGLPNNNGPAMTAWGHLDDETNSSDPIISNQIRQNGSLYNIDGTSGSTNGSTVNVDGFQAVLGEWNFVALEYTVGQLSYDWTVNGVTTTLPIRSTDAALLTDIYTFGFAAQTPLSGQDRGIYVDSAPELSLVVNTETGGMTLKNELGLPLSIDTYRITSATPNAFVNNALSGLDGANYDSGAWTKLASTTTLLAEATLGDSTIGAGDSIPLGNVYNTTTAATDLVFEIHVAGSVDTALIPSYRISYVTGAGQPGDFNGDGVVNLADYTVWRDNLGGSDAALNGNANNVDGLNQVNSSDYQLWKTNYGQGSLGSMGTGPVSVPEPATTTFLVGALAMLGFRGYRKILRFRKVLPPAAIVGALLAATLMARPASAAIEVTAEYLFGESEGGSDNLTISLTYEQNDGSGLNDLGNVISGPTYQNISEFAGGYAGSGTLGADFDGDDGLWRGTGGSSPLMEDEFFQPLNPTIASGSQMWVFPRSNTGRQTIMHNGKNDVGVAITADGRWTQIASGHTNDTDIQTTVPVVTGQWTHVMQHTYATGSTGAPSVVPGSGNARSYITVLYVDGEAVSAIIDDHSPNNNRELSFGAYNPAGTPSGFFNGVIDAAQFYTSTSFNLFSDNVSVRDEILAISTGNGSPITGGNVQPGDLNLDDDIDSLDEALFAAGWGSKNRINGPHADLYVGDLSTWQQGDLNLDGQVNLHDLLIMHRALAPLGGFNMALLEGGTNVPEPSTSAMLVIAGVLLAAHRRQS